MTTQKPYLDEKTGERFAQPPSPLPPYLVYLPESSEDEPRPSVEGEREALATLIRRELAEDSSGFGSCDLGLTIADAVLSAGFSITRKETK